MCTKHRADVRPARRCCPGWALHALQCQFRNIPDSMDDIGVVSPNHYVQDVQPGARHGEGTFGQ